MFSDAPRLNEIQSIALAYAPPAKRRALAALWELDAMLGRIVATTSVPVIGQMRLTWWHERLVALNQGDVTGEPVLQALSDVVRDHDVTGAMLAGIVEGWEALLEPMPLTEEILQMYASGRGERLFAASAAILETAACAGAGTGWALIDFAQHCSDPVTARRAWAAARSVFADSAVAGPKPLRIVARIAAMRARRPFEAIWAPVSRLDMLHAVLL